MLVEPLVSGTTARPMKQEKNPITSISITKVVCTVDMFPMNCLYQYLHRQEAKKLAKLNKKQKNHLYKLYLSLKLPGYWLQQAVFLKIYFLLPLQRFNWRCYSFAFLLTDRSIIPKVLREFKEIIIFKTKNRSFIIFTMYNLLDNSKGVRPFTNIWIWLLLLPLFFSATNVASICNFTSSVQIWL